MQDVDLNIELKKNKTGFYPKLFGKTPMEGNGYQIYRLEEILSWNKKLEIEIWVSLDECL